MTNKDKYSVLVDQLDHFMEVVYDNEDAFVAKFISGYDPLIALTQLGWSDSYMQYTFITDEGQHICDTIELCEWFEFMDEVDTVRTGRLPDGEYSAIWYLDQLQVLHDKVGYNFVTMNMTTIVRKPCIIEVRGGLMMWWRVI